eukprot:7770451-Pyramimonas_sp.AAC.1
MPFLLPSEGWILGPSIHPSLFALATPDRQAEAVAAAAADPDRSAARARCEVLAQALQDRARAEGETDGAERKGG